MSHRSDACEKIEAAKSDVAKAQRNYEKGGPVDPVNKANRRLADAEDAMYEIVSGRIPS
jgi:hypothetical protein